jgi:sugar-phosphatase
LELTALVRPKVLICADDVNLGKPDPEGLLLGASLLGVDPCNGVYIGDAMPDILAARAAGMLCIGVGQDAKQLGADLTVDTLKHLSVGEMRSDGQFVIRVR